MSKRTTQPSSTRSIQDVIGIPKWLMASIFGALVLIFFWEPTMTYFAAIFHKAAGIFGK